MLRKLVLAAALVAGGIVAWAGSAFAGDPAGQYSLVGSNPGGKGRYSGAVAVERTGDTFRVTWDIGGQDLRRHRDRQRKRPRRDLPFRQPDRARDLRRPKATIGKVSGRLLAARRSAARSGPAAEPKA